MSDLLAVLVFLAIPSAVLLTARFVNRRAERRETWSARHHTGGAGVHHLLHGNAHQHLDLTELVFVPISHGPGGEQRSPAIADLLDHGIGAGDPEVSVLLSGETRIRQVLGGG